MTPRQREVYDFITSYWEEKGISPSYEEIMHAIGVKSKSGVHKTIKSLAEMGAVKQRPRQARTVRPADMKWPPKVTRKSG